MKINIFDALDFFNKANRKTTIFISVLRCLIKDFIVAVFSELLQSSEICLLWFIWNNIDGIGGQAWFPSFSRFVH